MICPNCGIDNIYTDIYCIRCGTNLVFSEKEEDTPEIQKKRVISILEAPQWVAARTIEAHSTPIRLGSIKWNFLYQFVKCLAFSPDGMRLYSGSMNKELKAWNPETGDLVESVIADQWCVEDIAISGDGKYLVSVGWDEESRVWDREILRELRKLKGGINYKYAVEFSPRSTQAAIGSHDMISIWDVTTGNKIIDMPSEIGRIYCLSWSPDGKTLVLGDANKNIIIWNPATGDKQIMPVEHKSEIRVVRFSPDGSVLLSGGNDHTIRIWDMATHTCLRTLEAHKGDVTAISISPCGNYFASGSHDETIKIWSMDSYECLDILEGHKQWVESIVYSPDGKILASGDGLGNIIIWEPL